MRIKRVSIAKRALGSVADERRARKVATSKAQILVGLINAMRKCEGQVRQQEDYNIRTPRGSTANHIPVVVVFSMWPTVVPRTKLALQRRAVNQHLTNKDHPEPRSLWLATGGLNSLPTSLSVRRVRLATA